MSLFWLDRGSRKPFVFATSSEQAIDPFQRVEQSYHCLDEERRAVSVAADIMATNLRVVSPRANLSEARELMAEGGFRHLPVVEPGGLNLRGLISDRDLLSAADHSLKVEEVMAQELLTAVSASPIRLVVQAMLEYRVSCLPVCDDDHTLEGLITTADILKLCLHAAPVETWLC